MALILFDIGWLVYVSINSTSEEVRSFLRKNRTVTALPLVSINSTSEEVRSVY